MRANDEATDTLLRRLLPGHVQPAVAAEHVHYSVRLEAEPSAGGRPLHSLYDGGCVLIRDRRVEPVVTALLRHLDQHAATGDPHPSVAAVVLRRRDGSLVLVSAVARRWAARRRRWLASKGLELLSTPVLSIDEVGRAMLPPLTIAPDPSCLEQLGATDLLPTPGSPPSSAPIAAWVLASADGACEPISKAWAVQAALRAIRRPGPMGPTGAVRALSAAMRTATPLGASSIPAPHIVDHLPRLA